LRDAVTINIPADASGKEMKLTIDKVSNTQNLLTNKEVLASPIYEILKNFSENNGFPDNTFRPNHTVTRAEFAVMPMNTLKPQGEGVALTFTDTAKIGSWAQKAVAQAVQAGIITGYADGIFGPNAEVTRAEMAVMIANALGQSIEANAVTGFADDGNIPAWAKDSVAYVKQAGILQGKGDNEFAPHDPMLQEQRP
jgi:hypothetical protein